MSTEPHPDRTPGTVPAFGTAHAQAYAEGPYRQVPGFAGLHRMTSQLLAERVPADGRVLVVGAGGGLELKALADDHAGWTFAGIDPSAAMLQVAQQTIAAHASRMTLHEGYIDAAPAGPFDGATCLLTLHFVPREQRLATLREIHRRLVPGAPFIAAHLSFPQQEPERTLWIKRHLTFGGADPAKAESARQAMATQLSILSPEEDEAVLREAGFRDISLFYAGMSIRGWVSYA